jgi:hypothetical protein
VFAETTILYMSDSVFLANTAITGQFDDGCKSSKTDIRPKI